MENESFITVGGKKILYTLEEIDIYSIDYYNDNPRINYIINQYPPDRVNSALIEKIMLERDATKELIRNIEENKGLLEAVLVLDRKVIEGNTRLVAYRKIYQKTKDEFWRKIKANILHGTITAFEIFDILSSYHIRGKTPWDRYEKAACVAKMVEQGRDLESISRAIGNNKKTVENMVKAYNTMREKYLTQKESGKNIGQKTEEIKKYSYFEALYINKELALRAEQTPAFVDEFSLWVREGRIPKAQDVRELDKILGNKKAIDTFKRTPAEDAFGNAKAVLYFHKPAKINGGFYSKISKFRDTIREINPNQIKEEIQSNKNMKYEIEMCFRDFKKFIRELGLDN